MARLLKAELTKTQRKTLEWIKEYVSAHHGAAPTYSDICKAFGIVLGSAQDRMHVLERKGYLRRSRKPRSIELLKEKVYKPGLIPVMGTIAAGKPIDAFEDRRNGFNVDKDMVGGGKAFALLVKGDSMVEDGILDGDYVIIREQSTAETGETIVALIGNEATLKKYYREGRRIRLEPANSSMKPIYVDAHSEEFRIQGILVGLMRVL